jgi:hypothetical protein
VRFRRAGSCSICSLAEIPLSVNDGDRQTRRQSEYHPSRFPQEICSPRCRLSLQVTKTGNIDKSS